MAETHAQEPCLPVAGHTEGTCGDHDAVAWCRLSRYRHIFVGACQPALQVDDAADIEDDGPRSANLLYSVAQRALDGITVVAVVGKRGDVVDHTATPADGPAAVAFSTGERQMARPERPCRTRISISVDFLVDAPEVCQLMTETVDGVVRLRRCGNLSHRRGIGAEEEVMACGPVGSRPRQRCAPSVGIEVIILVGRRRCLSHHSRVDLVEDNAVEIYIRGPVSLTTDWNTLVDDNDIGARGGLDAYVAHAGVGGSLCVCRLCHTRLDRPSVDAHVDGSKVLVAVDPVVVGLDGMMAGTETTDCHLHSYTLVGEYRRVAVGISDESGHTVAEKLQVGLPRLDVGLAPLRPQHVGTARGLDSERNAVDSLRVGDSGHRPSGVAVLGDLRRLAPGHVEVDFLSLNSGCRHQQAAKE